MFGQIAGDCGLGHEKENQRDKTLEKAASARKKDKAETLGADKSAHSSQKRKRKPVEKEVLSSKVPAPSRVRIFAY